MPGPLGFGGFRVEVEVVDVVVVVECGELVVVVVVWGAVVVVGAAHDSLSLTIGSLTGREIEDSGVPGGTLTVNVSFCPPATTTVITHVSADAEGIAASPRTASIELALRAATISFRLLSTVA